MMWISLIFSSVGFLALLSEMAGEDDPVKRGETAGWIVFQVAIVAFSAAFLAVVNS